MSLRQYLLEVFSDFVTEKCDTIWSTAEAIPKLTPDAGLMKSGTELVHGVFALPMFFVVVPGSVRIPLALFPAQQT